MLQSAEVVREYAQFCSYERIDMKNGFISRLFNGEQSQASCLPGKPGGGA